MKPTSAIDGYVSGLNTAYQTSPNVHEARASVITVHAVRSWATK